MLQAIDNVHDRQFLAAELASSATLAAELAQPEIKNILLAYVTPLPLKLYPNRTTANSEVSSASGSVATIKSKSSYLYGTT